MSNEHYFDEYELEDDAVLASSPPSGHSGALTPWGQKFAIILGVLAMALAIGYIAWASFTTDTIRGKNVGFNVLSSEAIEITFDVAKPQDMTVVCTLDALNTNYAQVGTRDVEIGPAEQFEQRFTTEIRTTETAVTAVVESCVPKN